VNSTLATPTSSVALAATETGPDTAAPSAGSVSVTVGGVVSAGMAVPTVLKAKNSSAILPVMSLK
jgi:hypothetical protein